MTTHATSAASTASLRLERARPGEPIRPLDTVHVFGAQSGELVVADSRQNAYLRVPAREGAALTLGGAAGTQTLHCFDGDRETHPPLHFDVTPATTLRDGSGQMKELLELMHWNMFQDWTSGYSKYVRINGKLYKYYVSWLRDHVHCLKGMRYFDRDSPASGLELYADTQREDGMIWDKVKEMAHSELQFWRDHQFAEGDFIRKLPGNPTRRLQRVPVENDVEHLFLEGLYLTWKVTGDDEWMSRHLDAAIKAVRYSTSDPYRWSEKYKLLKRGYTIDTWDFQHAEDVARSGAMMSVNLRDTIFGVMHGDNTGMAAGCRYLAEMLEIAGRGDEAGEFREIADGIKQRLDELAWNGEFYRHHVSEDPSFKRDVGSTDESAQVSLSNAYATTRGLPHEQAAAIIRTYQRIREEMPASSPGEFYNIYPPFEKGFARPKHAPGEYMNGGVSTICAGELARGAFEHGFERYGADILNRVYGWTQQFGGYLHCVLKGMQPERPEPSFKALDLRDQANLDLQADHAERPDHVAGWFNSTSKDNPNNPSREVSAASSKLDAKTHSQNDLINLPTGSQQFLNIPFEVLDPADNGRAAGIGLGNEPPFHRSVEIPIKEQARTIYLLQAARGGQNALIGWTTLHYADGTHRTQYVHLGSEVETFMMPAPDSPLVEGPPTRRRGNLRMAWQGPNRVFENVGASLYALENPRPDQPVDRIEFHIAEGDVHWAILGLTVSDGPVHFPLSPLSHGIPDMWGTAALVHALVEGLVGVIDEGRGFDQSRVSPRWFAADENEADACVCYPNNDAYVAYEYRHAPDDRQVRLRLTTSGRRVALRLPLPEDVEPESVLVDGQEQPFSVEQVEQTRYVNTTIDAAGIHEVAASYRPAR